MGGLWWPRFFQWDERSRASMPDGRNGFVQRSNGPSRAIWGPPHLIPHGSSPPSHLLDSHSHPSPLISHRAITRCIPGSPQSTHQPDLRQQQQQQQLANRATHDAQSSNDLQTPAAARLGRYIWQRRKERDRNASIISSNGSVVIAAETSMPIPATECVW